MSSVLGAVYDGAIQMQVSSLKIDSFYRSKAGVWSRAAESRASSASAAASPVLASV